MKNSLIKRIAAVAFAAATILTCAPTTSLAAGPGTTGSVTITKYVGTDQNYEQIEENLGAEHAVKGSTQLLQNVYFSYVEVGDRVQVDTGEGNTTKTEMMYTLKEDVATVLGVNADVTKDTVKYYRQATLQTAIEGKKDEAIKYVKTKGDLNKQATGATTGQATFSNLSLEKLYLFAETDATGAKDAGTGDDVRVTKVSVPFFVALPFTGKGGAEMTDIYAYPKNATGDEKLDKVIVENSKDKKETQANIGDVISYKVTYKVPVGEHGMEKLVVTDIMDKGLTFDSTADNIVVKGVTLKNTFTATTDYTVTSNTGEDGKTTISITFTAEGLKKLTSNSTQEIEITYQATLNENAVLGQTGNKNTVTVDYKNVGDIDHNLPNVETKVFTYGIDLLKEGESSAKLENVEFTLTTGEGQAVNVHKNGQNTYYTPGGNNNTVITDASGKIYLRGLKAGTYKLTETKTNDGYVLLKDPVTIVITQNNSQTGEASATVNGKKVDMKEDQLNFGSQTAEVPLTVVNNKGFDLPATGGAGTALFTIAGIAIVAVAAALLLMRKKSNK